MQNVESKFRHEHFKLIDFEVEKFKSVKLSIIPENFGTHNPEIHWNIKLILFSLVPSSNPLQMVFNRNFIESCNQWSTLLPSNRNIRIVSCKVVYHFHSFNAAFRMNQPNKSKHTVIDGCLPKIYYHFGYIFKQSVWICLHSHQERERERETPMQSV